MAAPHSLWHADAEAASLLDRLSMPLPRLCAPIDLVVVGSGYAGLSGALRAARAGASVLVLDSGPLAGGASSLNGGTFGPGFPMALQRVAQRHGRSAAKTAWDISAAAARAVEKIAECMDLNCEVRRGGSLRLAVRAGHFDAMQRHAAWLQELAGVQLQPVRPEHLPAEFCGRFAGGLLDIQAGQLQPRRFAAGLAALAVKCGARLVPHALVRAIRERPGGCVVEVADREIPARRVLVATNRASALVPGWSNRLVEVGSYMIATEPLPCSLAAGLFPGGRTHGTSARLFNYFRTDTHDRLLFGGRNSLLPDMPRARSRAELQSGMTALLPAMARLRIDHCWGGTLAFFPDAMPRVGAAGPSVFFALGFGGHGLTMATFGGALAAEMAVGESPGRAPFDLPLPINWLGRQGRHSLRLLGWLYRTLDAID